MLARTTVRLAAAAAAGGSNDALNVLLFLGSTRAGIPPPTTPGGAGVRVGAWCADELRARGHTVTVVNPIDTALPLLQKPHFAYRKGGAPEVLEGLAEQIRDADAYVMVTPEYNHSPSPALLNTLNHFGSSLFSFKPASIVSYSGGQWGGTRAATLLRPVLGELGALPVSAMVHVPHAPKVFNEDGSVNVAEGEDVARWRDYGARSWSQLEWWGTAARRHREVVDPTKDSPPFATDPTQRNAP
mmetsp:Transcript_110381/g.321402  ORF Transcript_110381/g.321402 Transcript_110381/m.321402 type:complete len:243 (+) Transcript_110381:203-931(+)